MLAKTSAPNNKVIVCDDDADILEAVSKLLEYEGFEVIPIQNSNHLFQAIKDSMPDLVIVDLWMPQFNGEDIILHMKSKPEMAHIPIMLLSASMVGDRVSAHAGADAFMAKPFEADHLISTVNKLIKVRA